MKKLKRLILLALLPLDGMPMPEPTLLSAVKLLARPDEPTNADVRSALSAVEADGYVAGVSDDLGEPTWTLTDKGTHKARAL